MFSGYVIMGLMIAFLILAIVILSLVLKMKNEEIKDISLQVKAAAKNVDALVDHSTTDEKIRKAQVVIKKKIIEAKNEKDTDAVLNSFRNIFNTSKL